MPPIKYNPMDVVEAVNDHEKATQERRDRMDEDFEKRWSLTKYEGVTGEEDNPLAGFRKYTSNESRAFAKTVISRLSTARVIWKIEQDDSQESERAVNDELERFAQGIYHVNDERLEDLMEGNLQDSKAWHGANRGWIASRVLLTKIEENGETTTSAVITPLDPRNVFWAMGDGGLLWACHKTKKSTTQIDEEYGKGKVESGDPQELHDIFDFFDRENNYVCTEDTTLKTEAPHGDIAHVPIIIEAVGPAPFITSSSQGQEQWGESIYDTSREQWDEINFTMSVLSTMTERTLRQGIKHFSADGTKTFDRDPYLSGDEIPLSRAENEDVEPLGLLTSAPEAAPYLALVRQQGERGSLSGAAQGDVGGVAFSGFAINSMAEKQNDVILPVLKAMTISYRREINAIIRQYTSGNFTTMTLRGRTDPRNPKTFFEQEFPSDLIAQGGRLAVRLSPQLPKDEAGRYNLVAIARDTSNGPPMFSDRWILENILEVEDADLVENQRDLQLAQRSAPVASLRELMFAAANADDPQLAEIYLREVQQQLTKEGLEELQLKAAIFQIVTGLGGAAGVGGPSPSTNGAGRNGTAAGGGGAGGPPGLGIPPQVQPPQERGIVGAPIQQAGPLVPPGTPRPGAQGPESTAARLARINLVPPR